MALPISWLYLSLIVMFWVWGYCVSDGNIGLRADVWEAGIFCYGSFFSYFFGYDEPPPKPNSCANMFCFCSGTGGFYPGFYCFYEGFYIEFYRISIGFWDEGWFDGFNWAEVLDCVFVSVWGWSFLPNLELSKAFFCSYFIFFFSFSFYIISSISLSLSYLFLVCLSEVPPLENPPYVKICCSAFWMISNSF